MDTCKLLSCKCCLELRGLFLRKPVKYVNFQKLDFHIFILCTMYLERAWELNNYFGKLYCVSVL